MEIFIKRIVQTILFVWSCVFFADFNIYFSPADDITLHLIDMIEQEEQAIYAAMYMFTDKKIAQALIAAKQRGVQVIVILDQISMTSSGKGRLLQEAGICLAVHRTQEFNPYTMSLMHHKFLIFRCNKQKRAWLWTGSWNCTVRASQANDENVLVVDDQNIVQKYLDYFTVLHSKLL